MAEVSDPVPSRRSGAVHRRIGPSQVAAIKMLAISKGPRPPDARGVAIFCPRAEVRRLALDSLLGRDLREILSRLIGMIWKPFKYQVRPVAGPGSMGVLFVEGEKFNVQRIY